MPDLVFVVSYAIGEDELCCRFLGSFLHVCVLPELPLCSRCDVVGDTFGVLLLLVLKVEICLEVCGGAVGCVLRGAAAASILQACIPGIVTCIH